MKNLIYSLILLAGLSACVTTEQSRPYPCTGLLQAGDSVLIPPLEGEDYYTSINWYEKLSSALNQHGIKTSYTLTDEFLLHVGITKVNDTSSWAFLRKSGYTHILVASHSELPADWASDERTRQEKGEWPAINPEPDLTDRAFIHLTLFSLPRTTPIYRLSSKGETITWASTDEEGTTKYRNYGTVGMASSAALRKGIKNMVKACDGQ
jgi:hypothetical protein